MEFVKPEHKVIRPKEYFDAILEHGIVKDLHGDEEICENCHGIGIVLVDNVYGLKDDPYRTSLFPYTHQSLSFCPKCFNGVVHRCSLCGEIMPRGRTKCDCEKQREIDLKEREDKIREQFEKAPLLPKDKLSDYEYFYSECYTSNNGYFRDFDEFFEDWHEEHEDTDEKPEYVWVTKAEKMSMDAYNIVQNAVEDLYEDAFDYVDNDKLEALQEYLDGFCDNCGVGETYYESHKYKVRIPWEEDNQ